MTHPDADDGTGSGEGGVLGTPDHHLAPPAPDDDTMVVSGGGVADTDEQPS